MSRLTHSSYRMLLSAASASALLAALAAQANAQAPAERDLRTDEIIVTGTPFAIEAGETLQGVTVLNADDLRTTLQTSLGEALARVPGVTGRNFGPGSSRPAIRGLGDERIRVLVDGLGVIDASSASPDHAVTSEVLEAERIEILRGASALLYGGSAIGGVVNIIDGVVPSGSASGLSGRSYLGYTNADDGTAAGLRLGYTGAGFAAGLQATHREAGDIEIPGYAESARLRASEDHDDHDDADALALGDEDDHDHEEDEAKDILPNSFAESTTLSAGVRFDLGTGQIGLTARRQESEYGLVGHSHHGHEDDHGGTTALASILGGEDEEEEESPFIELEQTRFDLTGSFALSGPLTGVRFGLSRADYTHIEFEAADEPGTVFDVEGLEARLSAAYSGLAGGEGIVGVQHTATDFVADGEEAFIQPNETRVTGLFLVERFGQAALTWELGGRVERVEVETRDGQKRSFTPVSASVGVSRVLGPETFVGATLTRTERAPSAIELFAEGPHLATQRYEFGDADLDTEVGLGVEFTAHTVLAGADIDAHLFFNRYSDFITALPTGDEEDDLPVFAFLADDVDLWAAEVAARRSLGTALGLALSGEASLAYVRAEGDTVGNLPQIPPLTALVALEARRGQVTTRLEGEVAAEQSDAAAFELDTDGFALFNLILRWEPAFAPGIAVIAEARNLTDEDVRRHASPLKDLAPQPGRGLRLAVAAMF
jgi:iron complex outermembrane receptor protein